VAAKCGTDYVWIEHVLPSTELPMLNALALWTLCAPTAIASQPSRTYFPKGDVFPLVMMATPESDFARVRQLGFNGVHMYNSMQTLDQAKAYAQKAAEHQLFVMQNMPESGLTKPIEWWDEWVRQLSVFENIAWWHIQEERPAHVVRKVCEAVRRSDPLHRPTETYLNVRDPKSLRPYRGLLDLVVRSMYPTYYREPRISVISWLENLRESESSIPHRIACAELFGNGPGPSPHELRFDLYASLIAGAKGVAFYTWLSPVQFKGGDQRPDLIEAASRFAFEVDGQGKNPTPLGPVVLSPDIPQRVKTRIVRGPTRSPETRHWSQSEGQWILRDWPAIMTLEKRWKGWTYLFVVNCAQVSPGRANYSRADVRVQFSGISPNNPEIQVLFENRMIPVKNGGFTDDFAELGARVYRYRG
jgi:hypothetical protein